MPRKPQDSGRRPGASEGRSAGVCLEKSPSNLAPKIIEGEGHDHVMTAAEFKTWNKNGALLAQLRARGDAAPRVMKHGTSSPRRFCDNVRRLLEASEPRGARLVRGYKLAHIPLMAAQWQGCEAWKATFHMVVAHPPIAPATKWIYEDPNAPFHPEDEGHDFIFVPSSRAHAELNDEQVLGGKWTLGFVVGGNPHFCELVIADQTLRGRRKSVIGRTPEQCIAKRMAKVYLMPCFAGWHKSRQLREEIDGVAEMMGFPISDVDEALDMTDHKQMREAILNNPEALVDGMQTLHLMFEHCTKLYSGLETTDDVQNAFFKHYDAQKKAIDDKIERQLNVTLSSRGFGQGLMTPGPR